MTLSDDLRALLKDFPTECGVLNITATSVAEEGSDEATVRNVASHMSHTAETARTFYQNMQGDERSVATYTVINKNKRPLEEEGEEKELPHLKKGRKV